MEDVKVSQSPDENAYSVEDNATEEEYDETMPNSTEQCPDEETTFKDENLNATEQSPVILSTTRRPSSICRAFESKVPNPRKRSSDSLSLDSEPEGDISPKLQPTVPDFSPHHVKKTVTVKINYQGPMVYFIHEENIDNVWKIGHTVDICRR
jgi:hypothetical protein